MSDRRRRRTAVYLAEVTADFKPQRPWDLPRTVTRLTLYAANLSLTDAQGFVRTHNRRALQLGAADGLWAIAVRNVKYRSDGRGDRGAAGEAPEAILSPASPAGGAV